LLRLLQKILRLCGELEGGIIDRPLDGKVARDTVVRVAIAVRTHHPEFFAA